MSLWRSLVLTLLLSTLAGAVGVWGGARYMLAHPPHGAALHELLHKGLHLTRDQSLRIEDLERNYATKRQALDVEMRAANAQLAQAYREDHVYTPKVQAAIDRFHRALDALQKETMVHIVAMRSVLTPGQSAAFDTMVVKALTAEGS